MKLLPDLRAHGLETDAATSRDWMRYGACVGRWDLFTPDLPKAEHPAARARGGRYAQAVHTCRRHCPVWRQCNQWTEEHPVGGMVQAGVLWGDRPGRLDIRQPEALPCGGWCGRPQQDRHRGRRAA